MIALLGTLFGFLGNFVPELLKFWKQKEDNKHELAVMDKQIEMAKMEHEQKLEEINVQADISESAALYKSAEQKITGLKWVDGIVELYNSSVRPTLTYCFFGMYAFVKIKTLLILLPIMSDQTFLANIKIIWTEEDGAIFATIIGFWFGSRTLKHFLKK
jgi:hypothetical protein